MGKNLMYDDNLFDRRKALWDQERKELLRLCREHPENVEDVVIRLIHVHKSLFPELHLNQNAGDGK